MQRTARPTKIVDLAARCPTISASLLRNQLAHARFWLRAICDQPSRSFGVAANSERSPIINLILTGLGIFGLAAGLQSSKKTARHNRHICFRDEHAESVFERHHGTGARTSAFRENDEDRFFFLQFAPQLCKSMGTAVFPPHRQSIEHDCGEHTDCSGLKEDVARSDWESAFAMTRLERCSQNQRVEMTE